MTAIKPSEMKIHVRISIRGRVRPLIRRSIPSYFQKTKIVDFVDGKSSNEIINNATMSDGKVVASYGSPRSLSTDDARTRRCITLKAKIHKKNQFVWARLTRHVINAWITLLSLIASSCFSLTSRRNYYAFYAPGHGENVRNILSIEVELFDIQTGKIDLLPRHYGR